METPEPQVSTPAPEETTTPASDPLMDAVNQMIADEAAESGETQEVQVKKEEVPKPEAKKDKTEPKKKTSRDFVEMTRQEARAKRLQQELEQERRAKEDFQKKQEELSARLIEKDKFLEEAKKDPMKILESSGIDLQTLNERVLNDGKPTAEHLILEMNKKMEDMQARLDEQKQVFEESKEEQAKAQYEEQWNNFVAGASDFVHNSDKYQLLKLKEDGIQNVIDTMIHVYQTEGKTISYKEASDYTEASLMENTINGVGDLLRVDSVFEEISKLVDERRASRSTPAIPLAEASTRTVGTTLTNDMAKPPVNTTPDPADLSEDEAVQMAARMLKFT